MTTNSIAARFFFQNCSVTIKVNGDMKISRSIKPTPSDVVLNRNFVLNYDTRTFIGQHNEFYKFLS